MRGFAIRQLGEEVTHCVVLSIYYTITRVILIVVYCRYQLFHQLFVAYVSAIRRRRLSRADIVLVLAHNSHQPHGSHDVVPYEINVCIAAQRSLQQQRTQHRCSDY